MEKRVTGTMHRPSATPRQECQPKQNMRLKSAQPQALWKCGQGYALPSVPQANKTQKADI